MVKVCIIILNYNGWHDTIECLESVLRNNYANYQIVMVDNNSSNSSVDHIKAWAEGKLNMDPNPDNPLGSLSHPSVQKPIPYVYYTRDEAEKGGDPEKEEELKEVVRNNNTITTQSPLIFIQAASNLGFAGGNNLGIRYALMRDFDYVFILNNDTTMSKDALDVMVSFMDKMPSAGACGARLLYPDGSPQPSYGCFPTIPRMTVHLFPLYKLFPERWFKNFKRLSVTPSEKLEKPIKVDYPSGACLMVRRKVIDTVGVMDERFFLYSEETDWCYRMMQAGWDRYYIPKAEVIHVCGGSFQNASLERRIHSLESRLKFFRKHFSAKKVFVHRGLHLISSLYFLLFWKLMSIVPCQKLRNSCKDELHYHTKVIKLSLKKREKSRNE